MVVRWVLAIVLAAGCMGASTCTDCTTNAQSYELLGGTYATVDVRSHDDTLLRGFVYRPDTTEPVPVVIVSSPYLSLYTSGTPPRTSWGHGNIDAMVSRGIAVAWFSVRGTGISEGCFENKGLPEQLDQAALVAWAATQPWSSGRVAMAGISYMGTTPFMAAIHAPPGLATIMVLGPVTDPYTELYSPQGAAYVMGGHNDAARRGIVSLAPPAGDHSNPSGATTHACPETAERLTVATRGSADDRDASFWEERRLIDGFPKIQIPVLLAHGFQETAHPFQEDIAWAALRQAPKSFLLGQWDHEIPKNEDWDAMAVAWMQYWLQGIGPEPDLGVRYEDTGGAWHKAASWPPSGRLEALHLVADARGGTLSPTPGLGGTFRSSPVATESPIDLLCAGPERVGEVLRFHSEPHDATLAGNPFLLLRLEADAPGGLISAHVFDLAPRCEDSTLLTQGAADLRFHAGNMVAEDFPDGTHDVRMDLNNLAAPVNQLALTISFGEAPSREEVANPLADQRHSRTPGPYAPLITLHEGSHLVMPVLEGTLAGGAAEPSYPPRPFAPE